MDFSRRIFRVITATPAKREEGRVPHFITYGHDDNYCAAIKRERIIAQSTSISEFLADNEYFDGELEYAEPWPCEQCITVDALKREQERFNLKAETASSPSVPTTETNVRINIDTGETNEVSDTEKALAFVRTIGADEKFDFLRAMRAKLDDNPNWTPTANQATAILKCAKRGKPRQAQPKPEATEPKADRKVQNVDAPASEKQVNLLVDLARKKTPDFFARVGEAVVRERATALTRGQASEKITEMMKMPRPNKATA